MPNKQAQDTGDKFFRIPTLMQSCLVVNRRGGLHPVDCLRRHGAMFVAGSGCLDVKVCFAPDHVPKGAREKNPS